MHVEPDILVAVPVYNQPERLREVVERCLATATDVLVVDDGSDIPAEPLLEGLPVRVIRHPTNRGKGVAIRTIGAHAAACGKTHVITIDADGQHLPEQIPLFVEAIKADPSALIIGVRDFTGSGAPFSSRFGRKFGNFWAYLQTGGPVGDIQSGFRAYPTEVLSDLRTWFRLYAFEVEIVVRAAWARVPIKQVDVSVHYAPPATRVSHFKALRDNLHLFVLNTYLTIRSFFPWPHQRLAAGDPSGGRRGLRRWKESLIDLIREGTAPWRLSLAAMLGVMLGALPIPAHTIFILLAAGRLKLNRVLAVAASQLCMPPIMPLLCIQAGHLLRDGRFLTTADLRGVGDLSAAQLGQIGAIGFLDWFLGSLMLGPMLAAAVGATVFLTGHSIRRMIRG